MILGDYNRQIYMFFGDWDATEYYAGQDLNN
jgi:hypothetical protein